MFVAVQMLEGYFLTPKIMGGKTGLHPTVIIFSVFFWGIALDGILGMILAIPLTAFIAAAYARLFKEGQNSEDYQILELARQVCGHEAQALGKKLRM